MRTNVNMAIKKESMLVILITNILINFFLGFNVLGLFFYLFVKMCENTLKILSLLIGIVTIIWINKVLKISQSTPNCVSL